MRKNFEKQVFKEGRGGGKTLFTILEVASLLTLAILIQNWDVVKSETSFRISATLNWTFSQHADQDNTLSV